MPEPDPAARRWSEDYTSAPSTQARDTHHAVVFETFYRRIVTPLVRFLVLQGASVADAADVAQDTLCRAYERWDSLDNPRAWSYRVASKAWIRRLTSVNNEDLTSDPADSSPLLRSVPTDAWHARQDLIEALAALPPRQRQVMAWTLSGYTPAEIATELQLENDQVRANLRHARRTLADRLTDREDA